MFMNRFGFMTVQIATPLTHAQKETGNTHAGEKFFVKFERLLGVRRLDAALVAINRSSITKRRQAAALQGDVLAWRGGRSVERGVTLLEFTRNLIAARRVEDARNGVLAPAVP